MNDEIQKLILQEIQELTGINDISTKLDNNKVDTYKSFESKLIEVTREKDFYRRRDYVEHVLMKSSFIISKKLTQKQEDKLKEIIMNSQWGIKMKKKFLDKFIVEDLEKEKFNYLYGDL